MKRYFLSVFLLIIASTFTENEVFKNYPRLNLWIAFVGLVVILLPFSYLVSFKARTLIDKLLDVKNPTSPKRWMGGLFVLFLGAAFLIGGYETYQEQKPPPRAQVEVQSLLGSAKASIKAKDIKEALKFLQSAVFTENATNYQEESKLLSQIYEASQLLRQIQDAVSDHNVGQVLFHMTDSEFVAFKKDGKVPNKVYFSDPDLNEAFIEYLRRNRVGADTLREQERERQAIPKWRAEASTFNKATLLVAMRCNQNVDLNIMYVRGVIRNLSKETLHNVSVTAKFYSKGNELQVTKQAPIDDKSLERGEISTFYADRKGVIFSQMRGCGVSFQDQWKKEVDMIIPSKEESLSDQNYKRIVGSWVCNCEGNPTIHFFKDGTVFGFLDPGFPFIVGDYEFVDENHLQLERQMISTPGINIYTNTGKRSPIWEVSFIGDGLLTEFEGRESRWRRFK